MRPWSVDFGQIKLLCRYAAAAPKICLSAIGTVPAPPKHVNSYGLPQEPDKGQSDTCLYLTQPYLLLNPTSCSSRKQLHQNLDFQHWNCSPMGEVGEHFKLRSGSCHYPVNRMGNSFRQSKRGKRGVHRVPGRGVPSTAEGRLCLTTYSCRFATRQPPHHYHIAHMPCSTSYSCFLDLKNQYSPTTLCLPPRPLDRPTSGCDVTVLRMKELGSLPHNPGQKPGDHRGCPIAAARVLAPNTSKVSSTKRVSPSIASASQ